MATRALFLDRDGVINTDLGYVHKQQDFEFIDGIFELALKAHLKSYRLFVITNQAGIARGYYSIQEFKTISAWMCKQFSDHGAPIEKVYFSPYHPTEGVGEYKKDDLSRKPNPGMINQAKSEFDLDLSASVLIGDKETDIQAGLAAGVGCNILYSAGVIAPSDDEKLLQVTYTSISSINDAIYYL